MTRGLVVLSIPVLAASLLLLPPAQAGTTLEKIIQTKTLNIGAIAGVSTIIDPGGKEFTGYGPDAAKSICQEMEVTCVFQQTTWATFAAGLQSGKFDLSIAETFTTIKRALAVSFTVPVVYLGTGVVTLKTSKIRTIEDVNKPGVRVSVGQGTSQQLWAEKNLPRATMVVTQNITEVRLMDLLSGKADVAFGDSGQTARFAAQNPQVLDLFADQPLEMMAISWAVRHSDQDLLELMNVAIRNLHSTGRLAALMRQYKVPPGSILLPGEAVTPWK